jgi:hypothetical protein
MTYRNAKAGLTGSRPASCRMALAAAGAMLLGCGWPLAAIAADVNLSDGQIACSAFQRGANGSWTVMRATTIAPQGIVINLAPGQTLDKNKWVGGVDVTTVLDRNCGNQ